MTREWWWGVGWARTRAQSKAGDKGEESKVGAEGESHGYIGRETTKRCLIRRRKRKGRDHWIRSKTMTGHLRATVPNTVCESTAQQRITP